MQSAKLDVNKQISIAVKTGKVSFGVKGALDAAKLAKAKLLILASNCPDPHKSDIAHYAKKSSVHVYNYPGTSLDLGAACGTPYVVAALAITEPGDSEVLKLAET
jgi:large subunit ribosomal protein L30e